MILAGEEFADQHDLATVHPFKQVVVVANFSAWGSPSHSSAEYVVHNWPGPPPGRRWREVTQNRIVPPQWVGREPLFPWEAKVYALEPAGV